MIGVATDRDWCKDKLRFLYVQIVVCPKPQVFPKNKTANSYISGKKIFCRKCTIFLVLNMQTLFDQNFDAEINLLPKDGTVNYYGKILDQKQSDKFYQTLLETIEWKNDEAVIFGKKILAKRKVA